MNLMVINVSTRKYARAVRLPDDAGGAAVGIGDATSKSAVSRRFRLTRSKLKAWLASPLAISIGGAPIDGMSAIT